MAEPFLAEIRMFAFSFAPTGWAQCNGQTLPISQNTALFGLLGTTYYGGNGKTTFALPDLQGCAALHAGQGPELSLYDLGEAGGLYSVGLGPDDTPTHAHSMMGSSQVANQGAPAATRTFATSTGGAGYQGDTTNNLTALSDSSLQTAGAGYTHDNRQPLLAVNFCIALQGEFPLRGPLEA